MSNRYRRARALGPEEYERQIKADAELLALFGLRLMDVSGGLTVAFENELKGKRVNPWNCATIDGKLFDWLEPLLSELAQKRETEGLRA